MWNITQNVDLGSVFLASQLAFSDYVEVYDTDWKNDLESFLNLNKANCKKGNLLLTIREWP